MSAAHPEKKQSLPREMAHKALVKGAGEAGKQTVDYVSDNYGDLMDEAKAQGEEIKAQIGEAADQAQAAIDEKKQQAQDEIDARKKQAQDELDAQKQRAQDEFAQAKDNFFANIFKCCA